MKIPSADLRASYQRLRRELDEAYSRVMNSGQFILGPEVEAFEREFARYCEAPIALGVGNGLDALRLILQALEIGPGDEVIVPAHTFVATWLAVSHVGADPVPVDVDPETCNLDPSRLASAVTSRTRAILVVHLYGMPADIEAIHSIACRYDLPVIEDAAQAHGARYKGRRCGSFGRAAGFSFYPVKNLGAFGDAGAIVTSDSSIAERVSRLRNYGAHTRYYHEMVGHNSRLDELQAAFLRVKLQTLDEGNQIRQELAALYSSRLAHLRSKGLIVPKAPPGTEPVWHQYVIRCRQRDALREHLLRRGISTLIHYPIPPHRQKAYADRTFPAFPVAEEIAATCLSLPLYPEMSPDDVEGVCREIEAFFTGTE
jgi:dTDP-4-amino-4,6-dideoxygalactose transaminase